jgi:dipeptidyl aminopeptidase/acylaminoacyl peptidase
MVSTLSKPFSYIVPYYRFPTTSDIYTKDGQHVNTVMEVPLMEVMPKGFMATREGRRSMSWRSDKPASLIYVMALDNGNPDNNLEFRDEVFQLDAPFKGEGKSILKTINRYSGITWADDDMAIAYDYWWNTRNTKAYKFNPSDSEEKPVIIYDRNYQDVYSDPGSFVTRRNDFGSYVLATDAGKAFLIGDGYSPDGQHPFLDMMDLETMTTKRVYQSSYDNKLENIYDYDTKKGELMVRIESSSSYPNYFLRHLNSGKMTQLTDFENPFKSLENVHKEVINYEREDGLELSGTLYLPSAYDTISKGKLPMILWAYPREYKDKSSASQSTQNPNEFTYPYWGSPIYWVNKGYAVLDDAAFPIVGEGDEEPNDSFRKQLVANAKAAIDAVDNMGYIDRDRVAVGGHSYGAFMVANLLSHSDLFAAGIARSGAYNRTLTPFGFQSEERSYWEAPEVYYTMSPFMHADKMKTPLLLVHGDADNNSGTYPLQSERYFNALKGLGATVRLVMLPKESHGYRAKESILHLLWEQDQWLEKYVMNRKTEEAMQP